MSDLISRSALALELDEHNAMNGVLFVGGHRDGGRTIAMVKHALKKMIENAPAVDAVPVVHARWVKAHGMMPPEYHHRKQCSMCGGWALQDYFGRERMSHYCPNCGAKMDGGAEG